jgi:hypothetical protein
MNPIDLHSPDLPQQHHFLRFASLFNPGKAVLVPCDAGGRVDMDGLTEALRVAYLGARALVGRDYAYPVMDAVH